MTQSSSTVVATTTMHLGRTGPIIGAAMIVIALAVMFILPAKPMTGTKRGVASRAEVRRAAGSKRLRRRAKQLRPTLTHPTLTDLGTTVGRSRGVTCWCSVEDSVIVLGPPRSGKGLHTVISAILDAPGAVVTTSTRPDNLAVTLQARRETGPVAVFDPQGLAAGLPDAMRWSPIRGCESPRTALARAKALCADAGRGVENSSFWSQQSFTVIRCLLHAAAIGHRMPIKLLQWSLSALAAEEAADILQSNPAAAPTWASALEGILRADPRQRDSVWAMVGNAFSSLSDPAVLEAVSPAPDECVDPEVFLRRGGTLYLLGTAVGASATANLLSALIEDVVETARRLASAAPGSRLDTPLSLVLDEAANYPLPSLLPLMSEGGGSGISTTVVLQSLAQARARWGRDEAAAIWDAAIVKLILGGTAGSDDLRDLSALLGTREDRRESTSRGERGRRSTSVSTQQVPVYDVNALRTLPFGSAVLLLRNAPPIDLRLRPWTVRKDAKSLERARLGVEQRLRQSTWATV